MAEIFLKSVTDGVVLSIRVQPRASRNEILGEHGGALKIALNAPPVEGAANRACIELLARELNIKKAQIEIKSGHKSRNKQVLLIDVEREHIKTQLKRYY